ncbi:branched-chain amino acid transport system II carrier protein [Vespertiliibacter pulmonis]|uniref:Branched-chain amino acid transport system carrier protein n=1 Tax=Vespertiliibacter pulmonis TaxID=1443036 RepID=A0A3N4VV52_9PAST|nr:branched-chain amino acid transport system II carrier protein [Vespertiliibacter pulmonis]QLB21053.1 branched-chain amino acid transport system II carrier protein [Vespertiliibacter pulmonis]RPE83849.1 LIVCS family branched-chain amino acid:cation transporter [Vespertiliibacter pulmonis]
MSKSVLVVGFMLFAIFFGAGNLIFPPKLGLDSGTEFWSAISGFVITGVGLPLLGIIVAAFYEGGYKQILNRIHPWFSIAFLMAIYLAIGPFFAGPRTGATAYEIAILPFLSEPSALSLFIFSLIYFAIALWLSLNPSKMVDRIGAVLTPILLIAIIVLVVKAYFLLTGDTVVLTNKPVMESAFSKGILEGYFTMDALASLAFSVIVLNAIKAKVTNHSALVKQTILSGLVAAVALALIYISLGWIGNNLPMNAETLADLTAKGQNIGTYILNTAATETFGDAGRIMLGVIVSLACLTTTVGLAVAVSEYFHEIFPKISYKTYVVLFIVISFAIANQGLSAVISKSVPVLLVLYPISMTVILLLLINLVFKLPLLAQRLAIALVTIVSILSVIGIEAVANLPFKEYSMEWLPFAIVGCVVGYIIAKAAKHAE